MVEFFHTSSTTMACMYTLRWIHVFSIHVGSDMPWHPGSPISHIIVFKSWKAKKPYNMKLRHKLGLKQLLNPWTEKCTPKSIKSKQLTILVQNTAHSGTMGTWRIFCIEGRSWDFWLQRGPYKISQLKYIFQYPFNCPKSLILASVVVPWKADGLAFDRWREGQCRISRSPNAIPTYSGQWTCTRMMKDQPKEIFKECLGHIKLEKMKFSFALMRHHYSAIAHK